MSPRAIVTLHDVAPSTLDDCLHTLEALRRRGVGTVTLLVIPGSGWTGHDLDTVRDLAAEGYLLAGHGWDHRAPPPATLHHRVHAALISRDEGEHLSRPADVLRRRVRDCAAWFGQAGLETPSCYVPPAWAMGRLSSTDLADLPFRYYETLTGIRDADARVFRFLPLVGYLADTRGREWALRVLNALNRGAARLMRRPLRIAIHPPDLRLRAADHLLGILDRPWDYVAVDQAMAALGSGPHPPALSGGSRRSGAPPSNPGADAGPEHHGPRGVF